MNKVTLLVNGVLFSGWKSVSIKKSLKSIVGSFDLVYTDVWNYTNEPWRIKQEDRCEVFIDDELVCTAYVDAVESSISDSDKTLTVRGRDITCDLVDCSTDIKQVEFKNQKADKIIQALAQPFGIKVITDVDPGPVFSVWTIQRTETPYENMVKIANKRGLLLITDEKGQLVITSVKSQRAANPIIEGKNAKQVSASFDATKRFSRYKVQTQSSGSAIAEDEDADVESFITGIEGSAQDNVVRRYRPTIIKLDNSGTEADARRRAQWEATIRAAESTQVGVVVQGWRQSGGSLWRTNLITKVTSQWCGIDDDMLIDQIEYSLDNDSGTVTRMDLVPPTSYLPQPTIEKKQAVGLWKELN